MLDGLRGCAVLGMIIVHFVQFNPNYKGGGAIGAAITQGTLLLVRGKAHATFTILFGVGFAIQLRRADMRGEEVHWRFMRRLLGVALFGVLTSALAGVSDIMSYATSGVWLLFARRWPVRRLLVAVVASAMAFGLWPASAGCYQWATIGADRANEAYRSPPATNPSQLARRTERAAAEGGTDFFRLARVRVEATVSMYAGNLWGTWLRGHGNPGMVLLSLLGPTLPLLLLGFLALRIGVFDRPEEHRRNRIRERRRLGPVPGQHHCDRRRLERCCALVPPWGEGS